MTRLALILPLALLACSEAEQPAANGTAPAAEVQPLPPAPPGLECSIGGAAFTADCTMERQVGANGATTLVIRNAQGGFRRFEVGSDGAIAPADGAEPAENATLSDGRVEVTVGGDRYRIPTR